MLMQVGGFEVRVGAARSLAARQHEKSTLAKASMS